MPIKSTKVESLVLTESTQMFVRPSVRAVCVCVTSLLRNHICGDYVTLDCTYITGNVRVTYDMMKIN